MTKHTTPRIWEWTIQNDGFIDNKVQEKVNISEFQIANQTFSGTGNIAEAQGNIFYLPQNGELAEKLPVIANSLQQSLIRNSFVAANFHVAVSTMAPNKIIIEAKTPASAHAFAFKARHADFGMFIKFDIENPFASREYQNGYFIDSNMAKLTEPDCVSLSDMANYVQFASKDSAFTRFKLRLSTQAHDFVASFGKDVQTHQEEFDQYVANHSTITFKGKSTQSEHVFKGTQNEKNVNASTYFIAEDINILAENIKQCLMLNSFINSNYSIIKTLKKEADGTLTATNSIAMESLGGGEHYQLELGMENNKIVTLTETSHSSSKDSIGLSSSIELEVYTDINSRLGENKFPENSLGTYMTTLSKSYHGEPLWFNLNALMANKSTFSIDFLTSSAWCNTGTMTDYRFLAHRFDGKNHQPFYLSSVLYNITGYDRHLEENPLSAYMHNVQQAIYDVQMAKPRENYKRAKPLSNKLALTHIKGQSQYFNFIRQDSKNTSAQVGIMYKLYTQSGKFVLQEKRDKINNHLLANINTIKLKIDETIEAYQNKMGDKALAIGKIEVTLFQEVESRVIENSGWVNKTVDVESLPLTFCILPECLHSVKDFAFLNALGGWSTFNFEGDRKMDFKASANTIFKTQTPNHKISSDIESVYSKEVQEQFSVQTMPLEADTIHWLKEMSASKAVYELSTKRYIIVDEMNIKTDSRNELLRVEMKYRYSDN